MDVKANFPLVKIDAVADLVWNGMMVYDTEDSARHKISKNVSKTTLFEPQLVPSG